MDTEALIGLFRLGATSLLGVVGITLSLAVHRLSMRQREDAWLRHFADIHSGFWNDEDMKEVRAWLACEEAYKEVDRVLAKRRNPDTRPAITIGEYAELDKLDKFLTMITRVVCLDPKIEEHREMLRVMFFTYWLPLAIGRSPLNTGMRENLHWYVQEFYPTITEYYDRHLSTA